MPGAVPRLLTLQLRLSASFTDVETEARLCFPACLFSVCDFGQSLGFSGPQSPPCKLVTMIPASESP